MEDLIKLLKRKNCSFVQNDNKIIIENQGFVSLNGLLTLPDNVKFENKGGVYLNGLTTLPDNMFRNPKTDRILRQFNNIWYCGCFSGTTDELIEICKEERFTEIIDYVRNY